MSHESRPTPPAAVEHTRRSGLLSLMTLVVLIALSWLSLASFRPPPAAPISAAPDVFSAGRAMQLLSNIAQRPHPTGTPEQARVRDYLVGQLSALGLETSVQRTSVINDRWGVPLAGATIENIIGRLPGSAPTKSIVLMAHYDSVLAGPGASDDGAAVAALLETVRALGSGYKNDVIVLLTDGEEAGLLGAKAFMDANPLAKDVGLVLNFEARGISGPALMFETSPQNGWLIKEFASVAPRAFASSLFYDVYRYLPNDTDFTMFKSAGIPGLNFAYIDGLTHYHSALDTLDNVSAPSLQHHGEYALALTRHLANRDLREIKQDDYVYFDLFGRLLVRYPNTLVLPLAILAALLCCGMVGLGLRRRQLSGRGLLAGFLLVLLPLIAAVLLAIGVALLIKAVHGEAAYYGEPYQRTWYLAGLVALILTVAAALYGWLRRKIRPANLAVGAMLWWLLLTLLTSLALPGASYLFTWPLLFSSLGLGAVILGGPALSPLRRTSVLLLSAVPAVVLFVPLIYLISVALTLQMGMAVGVVTVLLLVLLLPLLEVLAAPRPWLLPASALLTGAGCLIGGVLSAGYSAASPQLTNVWYSLNANTQSAAWVSDAAPDSAWAQQFFSSPTTMGSDAASAALMPGTFHIAAAPASALPAPELQVIADSTDAGVRTLTLKLTSPRQAPFVALFAAADTPVLSASVADKPAPSVAGAWGLTYWGLPSSGLELQISVKAGQALTLQVLDRSDALPNLSDGALMPRPGTMQPAPFLGPARFGNATLVSKSFSF